MSASEMIRSLLIKQGLMPCVTVSLLIFITLSKHRRRTTHDNMGGNIVIAAVPLKVMWVNND